MNPIYNVGIYCRLSVDDASNSAKSSRYIPADESVSIENQRELLSKFAMLNGWVETKTYVDDGFSGGNFQRPGFLEMLEDARKGIINLILVKDLSRLGRDYVEVGHYTDVVFPSLGCRFVSVLDCLDSEGDNTDMLHFRSLMNDYHLRDLSNKVKSVLLAKKKSGQFLSFKAPYGYRKNTENRYKLVIDEYAAGVVRSIFERRASGMSTSKITALLNQKKVLPPMAYWYHQNGKERRRGPSTWSTTVVMSVLRNEVYLGKLVMNYLGSRSYKDSTMVRKPDSEHICFDGAHEAIISQTMWDAVQEVNTRASRRVSKRSAPAHYLFSGKLMCADCKGPLVASKERQYRKDGSSKDYVSYHCGRNNGSAGSECSRHTIFEQTLARIVTAEIRTHAQSVSINKTAVAERLKQQISGSDQSHLTLVKREITKLRRQVQELEDLTAKLYEDKYTGEINEDTFMLLAQKNEQTRSEKAERLNVLLSEMESSEKKLAAIQEWTAIIRKFSDLSVIDRAIVDELIDRIEIGERYYTEGQRKQDIKIFYRFVGQVQ